MLKSVLKQSSTSAQSGIRLTQAERSALAEEKMVTATIELLNQAGLAGTTLSAIGERAGYSRGLASHHFGTKSGLYHKVLKHITAVWSAALEHKVGKQQGLAAILATLEAHGQHTLDVPEHARAMFILWSGYLDPASEFKPNVSEFHRLQRKVAEDWVRVGQGSGEINPAIDANKFGEQFYASLLGLNYQWLVNPKIDLKAAIEILKNNMITLLKAK
jgi:AcrR family transcriptional regulator